MITALSTDELKAAEIVTDAILQGIRKLEIQYNHHPDKTQHQREFVLGMIVAYVEDVKS